MRSQIIYICSLRSQQVFFLLLSIFACSVSVYYACKAENMAGFAHLLDAIPMFVGGAGSIGIAGIYSAGSFNYHLVRYPRKVQVMAQSILAYTFLALASMALLFTLCAAVSISIGIPYGYQFDYSSLMYAFLKFMLLVFLFSLMGAVLGFFGRSVALSLFTYMGIVWFLPIIAAFLAIITETLSEFMTQHTVPFLAVALAKGDTGGFLSALAEFGLWVAVAFVAGYYRLRSDK